MQNTKSPDFVIPLVTVILLIIGVVMVHSASTVLSEEHFHDAFYYFKRQLMWASLGLISMYVMSRVDYRLFARYAPHLMLMCLLFLGLVLIPHVGQVRGGSRAWLGIGTFGIQPSEFAKFGLLIFLSWFLSREPDRMRSFRKGMVPPLGVMALVIGLIMLEPDLGQSAVIAGATMIVIFVAGAQVKHLVAMAAVGLLAFAALIAAAPYRLARVLSFLDPWKYPDTIGYHIIMSLIALGQGALIGVGLGHSTQKHLYLPEPQTDFIFAILSEELGLIGGAVVVLLFTVLIWRGLRAAMRAPDRFGSYLATGLTGVIAVQVFINIGVVTGLMPVTGITLPFLSYGGSSLTLMLTAVGILMNISRYAHY
ncbi:stage V sporulation protein E [Sulfoacidibacillus thermotolerans]|uniref:Stage V sporulation protein E n=1 Tax=Sulfoacidibacillus thermotolerans TaxID=1765684 RepID=A0A2U3D8U9_SULT2|nr:stage V sporulation protein E [Sulfoacidibacillus thermotolerans]PWI57703.1 stage V sporulation protein E [Sulfoacidibacillus thermotolerans]